MASGQRRSRAGSGIATPGLRLLCESPRYERQLSSGEGENVLSKGRGSLQELPNMATHREKLRAIHAADDITDNGCQHRCRSCHAEVG